MRIGMFGRDYGLCGRVPRLSEMLGRRVRRLRSEVRGVRDL
jgi:hypothetical protein